MNRPIAIVTGASRGIGKATALALAREGATVIVSARSAAGCEEVVETIRAAGGDAMAVAADVSRSSDAAALAETVLERFGRIDRLFHNAGAIRGGVPVHETGDEIFDEMVTVNLRGTFNVLRACLPSMVARRAGAVVVNSAGSGLRARPGVGTYAASKWGVIGLALSSALEVAPHNVRINVIAPGYIATETWLGMLGGVAPSLAQRVPLGRIGEAVDVAGAVTWLLSDQARYVTGIVLPIDGGLLTV